MAKSDVFDIDFHLVDVQCYDDDAGVQRVVRFFSDGTVLASVKGETSSLDLSDDGVPATWALCPVVDFAPSMLCRGEVAELDFLWLNTDGYYEDRAGVEQTLAVAIGAGYVECNEPLCSRLIDYAEFDLTNPTLLASGGFVPTGEVVDIYPPTIGEIVSIVREIQAPDGFTYAVQISAERLAGTGALTFTVDSGRVGVAQGADYRITLTALPDLIGTIPILDWAVMPSGMNGGQETLWLELGEDQAPEDYIAGAGTNANYNQAAWDAGINGFADAGFPLINWGNGNNTALSAFRFQGREVSYRINGQPGLTCGTSLKLLRGPASTELLVCEQLTRIDADFQALALATQSVAGLPDQVSVSSLTGQAGNVALGVLDLSTVAMTNALTFSLVGVDAVQLDLAPRALEVTASALYDYETGDASDAAAQRVSPILLLYKRPAATGVYELVAGSATGYQRHTVGHNDSSNTIAFTDLDAQPGDQYQLRTDQGSTQVDAVNITAGQVAFKAVF